MKIDKRKKLLNLKRRYKQTLIKLAKIMKKPEYKCRGKQQKISSIQ